MKKVLKYIFKDWKISDFVICALTALLMIALLIVSKCVKKPVEVKEVFSAAQVASAILLVWGLVFCSKNTLHGNLLGIGSIAFFSYFLFEQFLYGSFIVAMLAIAYLVWRLALLIFKKEFDFGVFSLWDYVFLFGGLAICAYPTYMLLWTINANSLISEILVLLCMAAWLFLTLKKNKFSKLLALAVSILLAVSVALMVAQLELSNAALVFALVMLVVFWVVECVKMLLKKKEIKQD